MFTFLPPPPPLRKQPKRHFRDATTQLAEVKGKEDCVCNVCPVASFMLHHSDDATLNVQDQLISPNISHSSPLRLPPPDVVVYVHIHSMCFCPFFGLFVFHAVIQFDSARSSSPIECCRFSPWSRKVSVPSLPRLPPECSS